MNNARRFVTEDKVDMIFGGSITRCRRPSRRWRAGAKTPQLSIAPVGVPPEQERWVFRLPQGFTVMAHPIVEHMKKTGVKTVGFLGYTDAYGESWLKEFTAQAEKAGIKVVAVERFARTDTSVTPQALKLTSANPDAMLVVASGSGAAMPHKAHRSSAATRARSTRPMPPPRRTWCASAARTSKAAFVVSGPAVIAEQLPDNHPSKKVAVDFVTKYEEAYGTGSRNQFAGHAYDAQIVLREGAARGAEEGQARHAGVPRRAARRAWRPWAAPSSRTA